MATLLRFARQGRILSRHVLKSRKTFIPACQITTNEKNKETPGLVIESQIDKSDELRVLEEHFADADPTKIKNWVHHGWNPIDRELDQFTHNALMFLLFTVVLVGGTFVISYFPDYRLRDWATREAYLEMDRREKAGLHYIDPYVVPPESVKLPSEEEIGDEDIII